MGLGEDNTTPERPPRAAVMADVGRLAGVSHQTVSRVINGSRHVRPETRQRVLDAMVQLGDGPHSIARALVAVEAGPADAVPLVCVDQYAGAVSATRHLLDLGHETVWHITGPADFLESQQRLQGWRETLQAAGAPVPQHVVGDWSPRSGYDLGARLSRDPAVTALFVANDQMALGVLRAMHEAGREIPRDISVVGFEDVP